MEASLRLHSHQAGTLTGLDKYLFGRTGGMIGSLSQLVRGAAILAVEGGSEQITRDLLDLVPVDHTAQRSGIRRPAARPDRDVSTWRRLSVPVPPARDETIASWLHRLAAVHGLNTGDLRAHLRIGRAATDGGMPGLVFRLASVTGYPPGNLAWALPELRVPEPDWRSLRHLAQRACPRCTARHQGGPVRRLFAHYEYLCTRHGYWIGPPDPSRDDSLTLLAARLPELPAAQRTLRRTRRRHGWAAAFDATAAATSICIDLRFRAVHHPLWMRWERRLDLLLPAGYQRSMFMAVIFPEVAALTAVLTDPDKQALTADGAPAGIDGLLHAAQHALDCADPPNRHDLGDALRTWLGTRTAGQLQQPVAIYPDAGHHDDGTPRITDPQRAAEQLTVTSFRRDRRAPKIPDPGAPMPYAHRPAPAIAHGSARS